MVNQRPHLSLRVPAPSKQQLTFCGATPRDLGRWLSELPKANLGETARQLYQALAELNQLITPSSNRLQLLELLRPEVHYVCRHLERHFLNQAIVLDERPRKVANLCQALQNHLAAGYKLIVSRLVPAYTPEKAPYLALTLQRAVHALCGPLVRASQLYCPVPEGLWLELHQLYLIAAQHELQRDSVRDELARSTPGLSVEQTYLVALMLGCARTNQMRQADIARTAEALESWSVLIRLRPVGDQSSLFAVAPRMDGPPRYRTLYHDEQRQHLLGIDPRPLVEAISAYLEPASRDRSRLPVPEGFGDDLLRHLESAWGDISERNFQRTESQGRLTVCLGMSAVHYFLAGRHPFAEVLKHPPEARSVSFKPSIGHPDIWANAFDAQPEQRWDASLPSEDIPYQRVQPAPTPGAGGAGTPAEEHFPTFTLHIVNHSPGGYCLSWPAEVPGQLQAGELLGIQDSPEQGWSVAVVRWIRHVRGGGPQMGIELIAPQAQPCGLRLMRKADQGSQYLRALLLPEITAISRPASVITPRLPFQEGNKVQINIQGDEHKALLSERLASTGSFSQFAYRRIGMPDSLPAPSPGMAESPSQMGEEDFDSLWKSL